MTTIRLRSPEPVIGIDASRLAPLQRTGTETYTRSILQALADLAPTESIRLYLNAGELPADTPLPWHHRAIPFPRFWTHARLSFEMMVRPPALLWVPAHVIPINHPRTVVTIHDLGYLHVPEAHPTRQRQTLDLTTRWSVRAATHIIAISSATRRDLIEHYQVPESRISVIPHGIAPMPTVSAQQIDATLHRFGITKPFILAVGTVQPRKNYGGLARALSAVKTAGLPHQLVIAGKRGWLAETVEREITNSGQADRVIITGYLSDIDLAALYAATDLVAFPSWYEGFGLPALEAMQAGRPLLVSNRGALPEVVGDAAWIVDPADHASIGATLVDALTNRSRRHEMTERGQKRVQDYSWEKSARQTLDLLRSIRDFQPVDNQ